MNLGISLSLGSTRAGPQGPTIVISASSIAENAVVGSTVGVLSVVNGTGTWTFTKTADPDAKFVLAGTGGASATCHRRECECRSGTAFSW